ncbi:unnamed protein product, partial [Cochlearia groenlandica]
RFIPIIPFPEEYTTYKEQLRRKTEVSWAEVIEHKRRYWNSLRGKIAGFIKFVFKSLHMEFVRQRMLAKRQLANRQLAERLKRLRSTANSRSRMLPRFQHMLYESHEDKCPPSSPVLEEEIALLARLEKREIQEVAPGVCQAENVGEEAAGGEIETSPVDGKQQVENATKVLPSEEREGDFTSSSLPLFKGGNFAFRLDKEKPYGFDFIYEGEGPFLISNEGYAGFQHMLYESHEDKCPPSSLVLEEEIASLARLEQRRTRFSYDYERLLASARSEKELAESRFAGGRQDFRHAKKEKAVKKLKERLEKAKLDNAGLKEKLEAMTSLSKARDLEFELLQKTEAEISCRICGGAPGPILETSETRLRKLKDYFAEEESARNNFLLWNQLKGVFETLSLLEGRFELIPPRDFVENLRRRERELEGWLGARPKLSYSASDFELPGDLRIDYVPEVSPYDEDGEQVEENEEVKAAKQQWKNLLRCIAFQDLGIALPHISISSKMPGRTIFDISSKFEAKRDVAVLLHSPIRSSSCLRLPLYIVLALGGVIRVRLLRMGTWLPFRETMRMVFGPSHYVGLSDETRVLLLVRLPRIPFCLRCAFLSRL